MKMNLKNAAVGLVAVLLTAGCRTPAGRSADAGPQGSFTGTLGLQLYSLRDQFAKDVPGTVKLVHEFGFREVELAGTYGMVPEELRALLAVNHLNAVAGHFSYERFRDDPAGVAKEAQALGLDYAGVAWIPHDGPLTAAKVRETAQVFNRAGEVLARHGIKFYYHNHGYEFVPYEDGTLFDLLVRETKPEFVSFQMDVVWVVFPGQDPVKLLEKHGHRWSSMHVKDLRKGVATGSLSGSTDPKNDVAVGKGQADWPALLRAAKQAGVKYYFIEDESPSVLQQIPESLMYLEQVQF